MQRSHLFTLLPFFKQGTSASWQCLHLPLQFLICSSPRFGEGPPHRSPFESWKSSPKPIFGIEKEAENTARAGKVEWFLQGTLYGQLFTLRTKDRKFINPVQRILWKA